MDGQTTSGKPTSSFVASPVFSRWKTARTATASALSVMSTSSAVIATDVFSMGAKDWPNSGSGAMSARAGAKERESRTRWAIGIFIFHLLHCK